MVSTSFKSAANSELVRERGGGRRNCDGRVRTQGVMVANCGPAPGAKGGGVGRHTPTAEGELSIPSTPTNGGTGGALPSVWRQAQRASATVWPHAVPALTEEAFSCCRMALREFMRSVASVEFCAG